MLRIQYLIYVYMTLCVCMMIYNIIYTIYNRTAERKIAKQKNRLLKKVRLQIALVKSGMPLTEKHKKYLYSKLKWTHNLLLFEQILDEQDAITREKYIREIKSIFLKLVIYYQKTDSIKKSYFAYIIGKYKIKDNPGKNIISNTLFDFINEESMYCRDNSLRAIIRLGDIEYIIQSLYYVQKSNYYFSVEMLFNNILEFEGNAQKLSERLWEEFNNFTENIQIVIIKFITKYKINYSDEFYNLLEEKRISNKLKVEIIRYFRYNTLKKVEPILITYSKLAGISNKELIIETAKTLEAYNNIESKEALKGLLRKKDWDIRMAASESLSIMGTTEQEIEEIFSNDDNITKRILSYKIQKYKYTYKNQKAEVS